MDISLYLSIYILNSRGTGYLPDASCSCLPSHTDGMLEICDISSDYQWKSQWLGVSKIVPIKCVCLVPTMYLLVGGGFKYWLCSPLLGEMIQIDQYSSDGLKPQPRYVYT